MSVTFITFDDQPLTQGGLPLIWLLGILPPPESFFLWLVEQVPIIWRVGASAILSCQLLVFGLGGSVGATTPRLLASLLLAILLLLLLTLLPISPTHAIVLAALAGYVLSTNLLGFPSYCRWMMQ